MTYIDPLDRLACFHFQGAPRFTRTTLPILEREVAGASGGDRVRARGHVRQLVNTAGVGDGGGRIGERTVERDADAMQRPVGSGGGDTRL